VQSSEAFEKQLTEFTKPNGEAKAAADPAYKLGRYLEKIPPLPVGKNAGRSQVMSLNAFTTPGALSSA
jgi:hypothetical protein